MKEGDTVLLMRGDQIIQAKVSSVLNRVGYAWVEIATGVKLLVPLIQLQQVDGSQKELTPYFSSKTSSNRG